MTRLVPPVLPDGTLAQGEQPSLEAGSRLILRPWRRSDVPVVVAAYAHPDIQYWHHRSYTSHEADSWIAQASESWSNGTDAEWAATKDGEVVGRVALRDIDLMTGQSELSYWTLPDARGQGIARDAAARIASWALDEIGFWRLEIRHSTRNPASCRVASAAGFSLEAELSRCHIHADGWHDVHVHTRFRADIPAGSADE